MTDTLGIAALPLDILADNPTENLRVMTVETARIVAAYPDVDLVVLPELFTTGFSTDEAMMRRLAQYAPVTVETLRDTASTNGCAIAGSFLAEDGGRLFNRGFFITPDGDASYYDKHHLFVLSAENTFFESGRSSIPVVSFRGWNIALMVCYDLRFPVWARNVDLKYDCLLVPANWPRARAYAWEHLLIARAIENQAIVVGANRSGSDGFGVYDNLTFIFDGMGMPIGVPSESLSGVVTARVSLHQLNTLRQRLPVSKSADRFSIL